MFGGASDLGDFQAEYDAVVETCGLVVRPDRGFVRVTGERRIEMLNGLLTNQLTGLERRGCHAMLLTAKGRVLTDLRVLPRTGELLLDVPRSGQANLSAALRKYLPPSYASFEEAGDSLGQLGLYGPAAATIAGEELGAELPVEHLAIVEAEAGGVPVLAVRNRRLAGGGVELTVPAGSMEDVARRLLSAAQARGGRAVGTRSYEVLRVESGVPAYGRDMDEESLAPETGLEADAISYEKGCYLGQEVVARIHFRGHVNRLLRGLRFEELPSAGAPLFAGGKEVGRVTSAVASPQFGPIGMGYVRREQEPGAVLRIGGPAGEPATVQSLPFRPLGV